MFSESVMQRLAFIKYLYNTAVTQSKLPEPLGAASLLLFHDCIELFLRLSTEYLNTGGRTPAFMDYWDLIEGKLKGKKLEQKESMRRLNKLRVSLKHEGSLPSKMDITTFRENAKNFFEGNSPLIFEIEFHEISMVRLVDYVPAKENLLKATALQKKGNLEEALGHISIAFYQLIDNYEQSAYANFGQSPFFFGESMAAESSFLIGVGDQRLSRFVDKVKNSVDAMQSALKILSLGIDYRKYSKFRMLVPYVEKKQGGEYTIIRLNKGNRSFSLTGYNYCQQFVVDSAIRLQDFDLEIEIDEDA